MFNGFLPTPDRVAFTIFGLEIMWYAIMVGSGMIVAVGLSYLRAPKHGLDRDKILDLGLYCIPAGVIGARLYYVAFNWSDYKGDIIKIINLRSGGLAIHGGIIFGFSLAIILLTKVWKQEPLKWMDLCAPAVAIAQSLGRWGNYFNSEAYGTPTDLPWAIEIDGVSVHPTFLYESIWCLLLGIFLIWLADSGRSSFDGQICLLYFGLYSLERFFVEGLRTDPLMLGSLRAAQVLSLIIMVICTAGYVYLKKRGKKEQA